MNKYEVIARAADLIDERGKAAGLYEDRDGCLCVIGAVRAALGEYTQQLSVDDSAVVTAAVSVIATRVAGPLGPGLPRIQVAEWSDANTKETVVSTLRQIAASGASNA